MGNLWVLRYTVEMEISDYNIKACPINLRIYRAQTYYKVSTDMADISQNQRQ